MEGVIVRPPGVWVTQTDRVECSTKTETPLSSQGLRCGRTMRIASYQDPTDPNHLLEEENHREISQEDD
jgi:hypothetical protein